MYKCLHGRAWLRAHAHVETSVVPQLNPRSLDSLPTHLTTGWLQVLPWRADMDMPDACIPSSQQKVSTCSRRVGARERCTLAEVNNKQQSLLLVPVCEATLAAHQQQVA